MNIDKLADDITDAVIGCVNDLFSGRVDEIDIRGTIRDTIAQAIQEPPFHADTSDYWEHDEKYCHHCERDTPHKLHYDDHERDSSHDRFICKACNWEYHGMTGKYEPPSNYC